MSDAYKRKLSTLLQFVNDTATSLLTMHHATIEHRLFEADGVETYGRQFANAIHDMPNLWSGRASHTIIHKKLRNFNTKPSSDHYHSRQRCGEQIAILIKQCFGEGRTPTDAEVIEIVRKARRVHYVTSEENQRLRKFMAEGMTWKQAYSEAGVELEQAADLFTQRGQPSKTWKTKMVKKYAHCNPLPSNKKKVKSDTKVKVSNLRRKK